jgi:hypothetical protein
MVTDNKQQRLVILAFWLALSSVALGIIPLQLLRVVIFFWGEPEDPGYAGFGLLIACPMWLGSLLSWLTSLVMVVIIAFRWRRLLYTRIGIATMLIHVGVLAYIGVTVVSFIKR